VGGLAIGRALADFFQPIDLTLNRGLLSSFDGAGFAPPIGYQLGLGGPGSFRAVDGRPATSAGLTTTFAVNNSFRLPLGATLVSRATRATTRSWLRRLGETQSVADGVQTGYPDLSLRWNFRPKLLQGLISGLGATAGVRRTRAVTFAPSFTDGRAEEVADSRATSWPATVSIVWAGARGLSTAGGYTLTEHTDARSGGASTGKQREASVDVGKAFGLPASWSLKSDLRARLGYQTSRARTFILSDATGQSSRLAFTGRDAWTLNADTDVSPDMTFTLQGSRVVTFDRNNGRRFTQTVISAVMHLTFFAGELR
jgi:hypothetical protein